ncbi:MAG TPA: ComF family protein [Longimicrobiales bacterium]
MALLQSLLDLVFSPICLGCDSPISPGDPARLVCRRCRARLPLPPAPLCRRCGAPRLRTGRQDSGLSCRECEHWPPALRSARSACLLLPPADRLVHQLKYRGWRSLASPMAERMAAVALPPDVLEEARFVVPVPTTPARRRTRGYNQAELLAGAYAARTGRQMFSALLRSTASSSQIALQPAERGANVISAFRVAAGTERGLQQAHILLVDDVLTTGATAGECARVLVSAGARTVSILTFARAPTVRELPT